MWRQALDGNVFELQKIGAPYRVVAFAATCAALSEAATAIRHKDLSEAYFWGVRALLALPRVLIGKRKADTQ